MKRIAIMLILIYSIGTVYAIENIQLNIQTISPDNQKNRESINNIMLKAGARASRNYAEYFTVDVNSNPLHSSDYKLQLMAFFDEENPLIVVNLTKKKTGETLSQSLLGNITGESVSYLSEVIFKLWADFNRGIIAGNNTHPLFLEEIPSRYIIEEGAPGFSGYSTASAIAVKNNGNIVLGMSSHCFELSGNFNIISRIGEDLLDQGNYSYAFGVSVTPGGTVYMKPTNGRDIFKAVEDVPRSIRVRAGIEVTGPITVLNNGVIILLDLSARKFVRIDGNKRSNLDLNLGPYTYVMAMTGGPEGNLWLFDPIEQRIKIYSDQGDLINSMIPVGLNGETLSPLSMAVYNDGSSLLYSNGALYKFNRQGILMWKMDGYQFREFENFPMTSVQLAVDSDRGYIYMADFSGNRMLKFFDSGHQSVIKDSATGNQLAINSRINRYPDSIDPLWEKIEYYLNQESWIPARMWLDELLNMDPFNNRANDMVSQMESNSLLAQIKKLKKETFDTIESLGPESARELYSQTVRLYERILSQHPENQNLVNDLNRFKESFSHESAIPGTRLKPITIASAEINNIFPSLIHYYLKNPVGKVTVKNELDQEMTNIRAELNLRQFIDYPMESEIVPVLNPGESIEIDLKVLLNDKAFNIEEDLPVLAQINVTYEVNGNLQSSSKTTGATLYRRTALSWDNTAKLAAFIMPNEGIVSAFSHRVLDVNLESSGLPPAMMKAARICDALGTYGISYVEDPDSPFSEILGKTRHVDTVRYPRTTLHIQSGDCDDTTALLSSLLESAGINTAIITSPGHVFLAFNTEEPLMNKWMFETNALSIMEHEGTIWIPIETTVLSRGFYESWKTASTIIYKHNDDEIDFVAVKNQRETFPPLPLAESNLTVIEPGSDEIAPLFEQSLKDLNNNLYTLNVSTLTSRISGNGSRQERQIQNKLGILHARFNEYEKAEGIFKDLISQNNSYISPYLNLGNIYYSQQNYTGALDVLIGAREIKPESVMVNLALARVYHKQKDPVNTEKFYKIVQSQSEILSKEFAYLLNENDVQRAGFDDEPAIRWIIEEE